MVGWANGCTHKPGGYSNDPRTQPFAGVDQYSAGDWLVLKVFVVCRVLCWCWRFGQCWKDCRIIMAVGNCRRNKPIKPWSNNRTLKYRNLALRTHGGKRTRLCNVNDPSTQRFWQVSARTVGMAGESFWCSALVSSTPVYTLWALLK